MSNPIWFRSLYWRIALGFVGLLATLLVVQGVVFLWMSGRMTDRFPIRSAAQYAEAIADDVTEQLAVDPLGLEAQLQDRFGRGVRAFAVATATGQLITGGLATPPPMLARAAVAGLPGGDRGGRRGGRGFDRGDRRFGGRGPGGGRGPESFDSGAPPPSAAGDDDSAVAGSSPGFSAPDATSQPAVPAPDAGPGLTRGPGPGAGPGGRLGGPPPELLADFVFSPVYQGEVLTAMVAVPAGPPSLTATLRGLGPVLAGVALVLLGLGTAAAALLIFRPAHRRLHALQEAAAALGEGQTGVRAPESGGDEVAALAKAFNEMAGRLEERTHALKSADRVRRQLLADVSHELTTPLAAIRGYVETLQMPGVPPDTTTRERYLGIVGEETERLEHIVGDLLDLARIEGGGVSLKFEDVSIEALFQRVLHRHEQMLSDRGVTLDAEIAPDAAVVRADSHRLEQALQNLVSNAVRHTPAGGRILVQTFGEADTVHIVVQDSGPGIPEEHLPHIFDRFYKADVSRTNVLVGAGSGLGLSIVQAIVHRHGGTITAANAPTGGARFVISLPASA